MRTLKLTKDSQKNILESLLKRSPNNYTEYESTVNEIINNVKENRDKAVFEYTKNGFGCTPTEWREKMAENHSY